jgi:uncharacterized protein YjbJ (UPF0337 family)
MIPNENMIKGKWLETKGDIQKAWGKLTDSELEQTKGDVKAISGLIQQKYGEAQDQLETKLHKIFEKFNVKKDQSIEAAKDQLK